jgi:ATP-dependent helicase/nuclease subunit A
MSKVAIPPEVTKSQIAASDPAGSAWVSANAGSGKTHVLAQRVIRLLLAGVDPAKILCLTFTKAAAANMAKRVLDTLAGWTALDDAALDERIRLMEGKPPDEARRLRARRLFAEALETPGGLKVQTIHAFCTGLLHQFPFEANVAAAFEVLDERSESEMIDRLRLEVLREAAAAPETRLGRALHTAISEAADITFAGVVRDAMAQRASFEAWLAKAGSLDAALAELSHALGVGPDETAEAVEAAFFAQALIARSEWPALRAIFASGLKRDNEHVARLDFAQAGSTWQHIEEYIRVFCTDKLQPRKEIVTKGIRESNAPLYDLLCTEQDRLCALLDRRRAIMVRDRSAALIAVADEMLRRYRAEKNRRGLLDYDDLIEKSLALLAHPGAAWVHYKLDLGIEHVLIDEAQDTSPQQWEVIRRLTAEFTAGEGARSHVPRSIFAVGDEKQSIYSFQGAAPHRFDEMRRLYDREHKAGGVRFAEVRFLASFRSAPDVLLAVDEVFKRPQGFDGLSADNAPTMHDAVRRNAPGYVELWELEKPEPKPDITPWNAPFDASSERSPAIQLANRIAAYVRDLIGRGELVEHEGAWRSARPGDVLVLVRQRGPLFEAIIRALKNAEIDVAGADRLVLTEHIAVMDLISLADALLLREDDLALAEALKSPLFGFDDDDLFALAYGRRGTLRTALRAKATENPRFAAASERLDALSAAARTQSPFAFYAAVLGAGGGRRAIFARLGQEANDALDEFLAMALDYERSHTPSLQGFVDWVRRSEAQVKRDMDIVRNEVRVMTVHGAKGLEAPIVILADTTTKPEGAYPPRLLTLAADDARELPSPIVWSPSSKEDCPPVEAARKRAVAAAQQEYRRLLYVAMTRAADRLVVCGKQGVNKPPDACWYNLICEALQPGAEEVTGEAGAQRVWRWRKMVLGAPEAAAAAAPAGRDAEQAAPGWIASAAAPDAPSDAVLAPSRAGEPSGPTPRRPMPTAAAKAALARGRQVHRLLQALPAVPPEKRADAANTVLARGADALEEGEREIVVRQVLALLAEPALAPLFAPAARAEAPIVGRLARKEGPPLRIAGVIDRLAVTADSVLIADFKTDRAPPQRAEDVPESYVGQLALYRALLARLFPGRQVRAMLIYSETASVIELSGVALDAALVRLGVASP